MTNPTRVVLADNHSIFRASLRQLLSVPPNTIKDVYSVDVGTGFQVVGEAGTGEETVRIVESVEPDLLLIDPSMPKMSGLDFAKALRAHGNGKSVPMIMVTTRSVREDIVAAVEAGVNSYIVKPFTPQVLKEKIDQVLSGASATAQ